MKIASKTNIILIPGIELSTQYESSEIHVLSYFIDHQNQSLLNVLSSLYQERLEIAEIIIKKLLSLGIKLDWDSIKLTAKESVGRPHIARAMVKEGYVKNIPEAFKNYLNNKEKLQLPSKKLNSLEAIKIINDSGGISVIAHPHTVIDLETIIPKLSTSGLSGLEIHNVRYSESQKQKYIKLAENFDLIPTGGSDFHSNESKNKLGDSGVELNTVKKMMQRAISIHKEKVGWTDNRLVPND